MNLRTAVAQRFSDKVDYKQYEGQIQKLIDQHISTQSVEQLTQLVNIFDEEAFEKELEKTVGAAAKADTIASRTSKHISEKMDEDPAFYRKFSQMIQQTINDFYNQRISELEYLSKIKEHRDNVMNATDSDIPETIRNKPGARANFGIVKDFYKENEIDTDECEELLIAAALRIEEIIEGKKIINWEIDQDVQNKLVVEIGDYIFDKVNNQIGVELSFAKIDEIVKEMVSAAKTRG
jgi:type I restriction enzyme R subunit